MEELAIKIRWAFNKNMKTNATEYLLQMWLSDHNKVKIHTIVEKLEAKLTNVKLHDKAGILILYFYLKITCIKLKKSNGTTRLILKTNCSSLPSPALVLALADKLL